LSNGASHRPSALVVRFAQQLARAGVVGDGVHAHAHADGGRPLAVSSTCVVSLPIGVDSRMRPAYVNNPIILCTNMPADRMLQRTLPVVVTNQWLADRTSL
jgi:hypothetical protein